jgi:hypothetical protein
VQVSQHDQGITAGLSTDNLAEATYMSNILVISGGGTGMVPMPLLKEVYTPGWDEDEFNIPPKTRALDSEYKYHMLFAGTVRGGDLRSKMLEGIKGVYLEGRRYLE